MHWYRALGALLKAAVYGTDKSTAPRLTPAPATLERPEGARRYLVALPTRPSAAKRPLVVILHGAGASPEQVLGMAWPPSPLSLWLAIAEREGLVVMAPAAGRGGWNDCFASTERVAKKDDVAFIDALVAHAIAEHDVDPRRVYLIGVSRGGHMAFRVAAEIPHRLAAFSSVLANMPPPGCARMPDRPLPVLFVGGTADPLIPYRGGKFFYTLGFLDRVASIDDSVRVWRELAALPDAPRVQPIPKHDVQDKTRATYVRWGAAADGMEIGLVRIDDGGHVEPSRLRRYAWFVRKLVGEQNADVEMAETAWEFFRDKRS